MKQYYKITVHIPTEHADNVRAAMGEAGAGSIVQYSHCSFSVTGTGRFRATAEAQPAFGSVDVYEQVPEECIETFCDATSLTVVVAAIKEAHPYEEPAVTVCPVEIA